MNFEKIAVHVPTILLPKEGTDLQKWAVVACDQYTSQPDYWDRVRRFAGDSPSTLKLTLPEVYLESPDVGDMITAINKEMEACLAAGRSCRAAAGVHACRADDSPGQSAQRLDCRP